jgi:hypothetical protein
MGCRLHWSEKTFRSLFSPLVNIRASGFHGNESIFFIDDSQHSPSNRRAFGRRSLVETGVGCHPNLTCDAGFGAGLPVRGGHRQAGFARASVLPTGTRGISRPAIHVFQVPHDDGERMHGGAPGA